MSKEVGLGGLIWWWLKWLGRKMRKLAPKMVILMKKWIDPLGWRIMILLSMIAWILGCFTPSTEFKYGVFVFLIISYMIYFVYKILIEKGDTEKWLKVIVLGGMVMRMLYVLMAGYRAFEYHDAGAFAGPEAEYTASGHFGYMEYIMKHWSMPPQNPVEWWSFYNPPLYYIVSAVMLSITGIFTAAPLMYESVQIVSLIFASLTVWNMYKMLKELNVGRWPMILVMAIVAFHPWFAMAATMTTPDTMVMFFSVVVLRYLLQWLRMPSTKNTVKIAVMLGLGALTKLSAAMLIPAILFAFLYKKRVRQLAIGILVCMPMMLFNPVRMMAQFHLSPLWTQTTGFVGDPELTPLQHLVVPAAEEFSHALPQPTPDGAPGGNIWVQAVRTSLFNELKDDTSWDREFEVVSFMGFYAAVLLAIMANAGLVGNFVMRRKTVKTRALTVGTVGTLVTAYATALVCFLNYNIDQPFFCTTNYRYIGFSMLIPLACSGIYITRRPNGKFAKLFYIVGIVFVVAAVILDFALLLEWIMGAGWAKPWWMFYNM